MAGIEHHQGEAVIPISLKDNKKKAVGSSGYEEKVTGVHLINLQRLD